MDRPQTRGEEVANSISHGVGFLLAVAALPVPVSACVARGGHAINVAAVCVFAAMMMLLYGYFRSTTIGTNCSASRTRCATPCASSRLAYGPACRRKAVGSLNTDSSGASQTTSATTRR